MPKQTCCECSLRRHAIPITLNPDGTILYCCVTCWHRLDYGSFLKNVHDIVNMPETVNI